MMLYLDVYNKMSGCRIRTNMMSGSNYEKPVDAKQAKEINDKLAAIINQRQEQDKAFLNNTLSDKEYEEKYGKQPNSNEGKPQ
jgi:hypothetical protein